MNKLIHYIVHAPLQLLIQFQNVKRTQLTIIDLFDPCKSSSSKGGKQHQRQSYEVL